MQTVIGTMKDALAYVADGGTLSEAQSEHVFELIMTGDATPAQTGAFLMALRVRQETVDEITGAARIMRAKVRGIEVPPDAIDTCGTGGDCAGTYNVSTAAALVAAACGVPVAKHGNRALSSKSGSADVLAALGVNLDADEALMRQCLTEANFAFMMAPKHHSAMRHVAGPRLELGTRTIFNLIGPLANPAGVKRQLLGVYSEQWIVPLARVLGRLGARHVWVVCGDDGLDELTTTGPSKVAEFKDGRLRLFEVHPGDVGLATSTSDQLKGGDPEFNAHALTSLLAGEAGPYRDIVALNAAAALIVGGKAVNLRDGVRLAEEAIDRGRAAAVLEQVVGITNRGVPASAQDR